MKAILVSRGPFTGYTTREEMYQAWVEIDGQRRDSSVVLAKTREEAEERCMKFYIEHVAPSEKKKYESYKFTFIEEWWVSNEPRGQ